MIFTNTQKGIRIELLSPTELKLDLVPKNDHQLIGIGRIITAYIRRAPLDGGERVHFELVRNADHILCTGNLTGVIVALRELEYITDELKNSISRELEQMLSTASVAPAASVSEPRILPPSPHVDSTASLFSQPHIPYAETQAQRAQRCLTQFSELVSSLSPEERNQFGSPLLRILQLPGVTNIVNRLPGQQQEACSPPLRGRS